MKKIICSILALALVLSFAPLTVSASGKSDELITELLDHLLDGMAGEVSSFGYISPLKVRRIKKYTSFGDSTVFGYGLQSISGNDDAFKNHYGYGVISDGTSSPYGIEPGKAYPLLLAEKLNIKVKATECESPSCSAELYMSCNEKDNHFAQQAMGLLRPEDLLALITYDENDLEPFINDSFLKRTYFGNYILTKTTGKYYTCNSLTETENLSKTDAFLKIQKNYLENIKNSDLITVSIGGNSMSSFVRFLMQNSDIGEELLDYELSKYISSTDLLNYYLDKIIDLLDKSGIDIGSDFELAGINIRKGLPKYLLYTYLTISTNTIKLIEEMHSINKEAIIVTTGVYNPLDAITLNLGDSDISVKIGKFATIFTNRINSAIREFAVNHSDYCAYVYVQDAEIISDRNEISLEMMVDGVEEFFTSNGLNAHESAKGHEFIADEIYKTLTKRCIFNTRKRSYRI